METCEERREKCPQLSDPAGNQQSLIVLSSTVDIVPYYSSCLILSQPLDSNSTVTVFSFEFS